MSVGIRGRLLGMSLLLVAALGTLVGVATEHTLRDWLLDRVHSDLRRQADMAREALRAAAQLDPAQVDELADRMGAASESRITFIAADGRLLGDSWLTLEQLRRADDHLQRPEVVQAREVGWGSALRYSVTVRKELLYVAVPFSHQGTTGYVRAAVSPLHVEEVIGRLRMLLLIGGALAGVVAVFMTGLASKMSSRTLATLVEHARSLVRGEEARIEIASTDEIGHLAGSFNQLATELNQAVSLLGSERQRFEAVLESMSEAVIALDAEHKVTLINPAAMKLLGLEVNPENRPLVEAVRLPALHELVAEGTDGSNAAELVISDGGRRVVAARATPLRGGGSVVVMHDVTDIRRLETIRRDFVANVSHELRTPVSVIRANAETLLLQGAVEDPTAAVGFLKAILRNSERLSRIIADLLDLARIEAGRYAIDLKPLHLDEAVRKTVDALQQAAHDKGIRISIDSLDGFVALADAKAFDQVLFNLLDNAIKYSSSGAHVGIRAEDTGGDKIRVVVEDDGPGIEAKHRKRIFERFYRVDPGRSRDMGGTGLGLSIVKHLVEHMHGAVGVEPRSPRGSAFWFTMQATTKRMAA